MSVSFREADKLMANLDEKLAGIKDIMVSLKEMKMTIVDTPKNDVLPIPVVRDRNGTSVKEHTVKEHFAKLNEEVDEFKNEILSIAKLDEKLGEVHLYYEDRGYLGNGN